MKIFHELEKYESVMFAEPPDRDDTLPDLYRLMDSLEDGKTDLEVDSEPPSLFTRPEHVPNYKKITDLKLELEEEDIGPYMEEFDEGVKDDLLMIGSISLDEVQVCNAFVPILCLSTSISASDWLKIKY